MNWTDLGIAVSLYNEEGDKFPSEPLNYVEERYTKCISSPDAATIIKFLNEWGRMRMYFDEKQLNDSIQKSKDELDKLRNLKFETISIEDIQYNAASVFNKIFAGTGSNVAAAKVLHVLKPDLFVAWDTTILAAYGCGMYSWAKSNKSWGETYVIFLKRSQKALHQAIDSYAKEFGHQNLLNAAVELQSKLYVDGKKAYAKILDEYNFMKFTKGKDQLWLVDP